VRLSSRSRFLLRSPAFLDVFLAIRQRLTAVGGAGAELS
jgi:hypothetical protein